ncbi:hypothetical protein COMNV_00194 [Commensalibacter sp. Nvir]|uniref:cell division protein FtsX n=1 Tax=Commensalibacter sp. Nvir TaxID=3069817 RepID=UPI002D3BC14E|nr:hypothetical protein COMNV_00194 [Commensalibacter sp. Nvir]
MRVNHRNSDGLKLTLALPGRLLIPLIAAMTFLAALTLSGAYASHQLAQRWSKGATSTLILQILPNMETFPIFNHPGELTNGNLLQEKINSVISVLSSSSELESFHHLTPEEINSLLFPWLHEDIQKLALPLPEIIEIHLKKGNTLSIKFEEKIKELVPDIVIEKNNFWEQRLNSLADSLQTCSLLSLMLVFLIAGSVIALSTKTGLIQCKQTIEILHNMGASDPYICTRFAKRNAFLALVGGLIGSLCSLPFILFFIYICLPFSSNPNGQQLLEQSWLYFFSILPYSLLGLLTFLPICNYVIGWTSTTIIVFYWLRQLS